MERVLIIGSPGAGKSTLARALAQITGLPLIHLDREHWQPGWVERGKAEAAEIVQALIARPRWIIDGNYGGSLALRLTRADTVVDLDLPRWQCIWGILRRLVAWRGRSRPDIAEGCPERLDWAFLLYTFHFKRHGRRRIEEKLQGFAGQRVRLRSRREVRAFVDSLTRSPG